MYGRELLIHGERNRAGVIVLICAVADDERKAVLEIPAWMFDAATCCCFRQGAAASASVDALRSLNELRNGAALIVTNPDLTHPEGQCRVVPETGTLLAALMAGAGIEPSHVVGKPEAPLFEEALRRLGSTPENTIVVGDNPVTDQEGSRRLGLRCVMVNADRKNRLPNLADLCAAPLVQSL